MLKTQCPHDVSPGIWHALATEPLHLALSGSLRHIHYIPSVPEAVLSHYTCCHRTDEGDFGRTRITAANILQSFGDLRTVMVLPTLLHHRIFCRQIAVLN